MQTVQISFINEFWDHNRGPIREDLSIPYSIIFNLNIPYPNNRNGDSQ